jgi:hypothetical protein
VTVATTYPPLPVGTKRVDVLLPGVGSVRGVRVTEADDAARLVKPAVERPTGTWSYVVDAPPLGSPTQDWPTDLPDTEQLTSYVGQVDHIVDRPAAS